MLFDPWYLVGFSCKVCCNFYFLRSFVVLMNKELYYDAATVMQMQVVSSFFHLFFPTRWNRMSFNTKNVYNNLCQQRMLIKENKCIYLLMHFARYTSI